MKKITERQFSAMQRLDGHEMFESYDLWYRTGLCMKHSTHDSVFFIVKQDSGFKAVKFYNGGLDYRIGSSNEGLAEAYNEAVHIL